MSIFKRNCCDGIYHSYDVHFTNACDNRCAFCVDKGAIIINQGRPNWRAIANSIIANQTGFDDVLVLGGEPCLFLDELVCLIKALRENTGLKLYVTSSVPKTCYNNQPLFFELLSLLDGFNISAQHHIESVADKIRGVSAAYPRQAFYQLLPHKDKIRINLNVVRGVMDTRKLITDCLVHYDNMGFSSFKLSEIQHASDSFISFTDIFDISLPSPYFAGCQTSIDTEKVLGVKIKSPVLLKRSCFLCESTLKASFMDGMKLFYKIVRGKPLIDNTYFGVVYEDGSIRTGWIKENNYVD